MTTTDENLDFASFTLTAKPTPEPVDREAFRGMSPNQTACLLVEMHAQRKRLVHVTRKQRVIDVKVVLDALARRGHDLATVDASTTAMYREWLRVRVERGIIAESYASHLAIAWNATIRAVLGDEGSESLRIKGFKQHAKRVVRLGSEEMFVLVGGASRIGYWTEDDKSAFLAYLELAWPSAGRAGSLLTETLSFEQIDWERATLRFRHVKNKPEHEVVLNERTIAKFRERRAYCATRPWWRGDATPILAGRTGKPLTNAAVNGCLREHVWRPESRRRSQRTYSARARARRWRARKPGTLASSLASRPRSSRRTTTNRPSRTASHGATSCRPSEMRATLTRPWESLHGPPSGPPLACRLRGRAPTRRQGPHSAARSTAGKHGTRVIEPLYQNRADGSKSAAMVYSGE